MRVLHAVTLITPDGAYGGPVQVALNQAVSLCERGHEVTVAAGVRGYATPPTQQQTVPLVLRPARSVVPGVGFAGTAAPGLLRWLRNSRQEFDVIHLHLARDLVMLPLAMAVARAGLPYVVQSHGMLAPRSNWLAPVLDAACVRRILAGAAAVFHLTDDERTDLEEVGRGEAELRWLPNGVPRYEQAPPVAVDPPEVLFLARLHQRKRPLDFVDAAVRLLESGVDATFTLVGPDEGEGSKVTDRIGSNTAIAWTGAVAMGAAPDRLRRASVYVLPAVDEPYPMSVLEAMAVGVPVVVTEGCGLAEFVRRSGGGRVTEPGAAPIAAAIAELLADPDRARAIGLRGRAAVQRELGMDAIAARLEDTYRLAIDGARLR